MVASETQNNHDLHGNVPDTSGMALLLIHVIIDPDFPNNERVVRLQNSLAINILGWKKKCRVRGIPTIYVNDNRGGWRSDSAEAIKAATRAGSPGRGMATRLKPKA